MAPRPPSREPSVPRYNRALSAPIGRANLEIGTAYSENKKTLEKEDDI